MNSQLEMVIIISIVTPNEGAMPSGQVAGIIKNLPSCKELIDQIMEEFNIAVENFKKIEEKS